MEHLTKSKQAKEFLAKAGIEISPKSCYNSVTLVNVDGETLEIESDLLFGITGVPGLYVKEG